MISVITTSERTESLAAIIFSETSTLGLRISQAERRVLARQISEVETSYGKVRIKHNENGSYAPEYDDCRQAATSKGVPLRTVISEANQLFAQQRKSSQQ